MTVLGGCATVTRGTSEMVEVTSDPPGAAVTTSIDKTCKPTPCSIEAPRKTEFAVTISKPGYVSQTVEVKAKLSAKGAIPMAGNMALPGGTLGLVTDVVTGAGLDHEPNPVSVKLQPARHRKVRNRSRRSPLALDATLGPVRPHLAWVLTTGLAAKAAGQRRDLPVVRPGIDDEAGAVAAQADHVERAHPVRAHVAQGHCRAGVIATHCAGTSGRSASDGSTLWRTSRAADVLALSQTLRLPEA